MSRRVAALLLLAATALALAGGFALKDQCTRHAWDGFQYRSSCYTDVIALYSARGLAQEPVPYINGDGELTDPEAGDLEYPVGTGFIVGLAASLATDSTGFFRITSIALALAGLGAALALSFTARDPRRVAFFALGPPVVLYGFHNWDLLAVAAMAVGFWYFARGRDVGAGIAFGIGTATKLFPGVVLPVLFFARLHQRRRIPWPLVAGAAGAFIAWNLPILVANPDGWLLPWRFQSTRFPNYETSWYFIYRHLRGDGASSWWFDAYPSLTGLLSVGVFAVALGVLIAAEWRRPVFRPYATSMGALLLFLLTAKVYSPQFALWILPMFVLVRLGWRWFAVFILADAAVWVAVSGFLLSLQYGVGDAPFRETMLEIAVVVRYVVLGALVWATRRAEDNAIDPPSPLPPAPAAAGLGEPRPAREDDHPEGR